MNPETLKAMKESAQQAASWNSTEATRFRGDCTPQNILALIADYERLKDENERLRSKTVLCGNCGYRYQSPRDDGRHGLEICD